VSAELQSLLSFELPDCVPHEPTDRQWAAMALDEELEVMYGGAAGGGKSDWLLAEAARYVDVAGYSALLLRTTYPQLSQADGLIERSKEWFAGFATWKEADKKWTFPSGATIAFGHIQHENDKYNFHSGAWQFIGVDELTQFTKTKYTYMFSRLRRPSQMTGRALADVPLRMRGASNPGGIGHQWVKERFPIGGRTPEHVREHRWFVPAKLDDNPHLDREEYVKSLAQLHPFERKQLLDGDWDVRPIGSRFRREWFEIVAVAPAKMRRGRRWDFAATVPKKGRDPDWTVGTLGGMHDGILYIEDVQRFRGTPDTVDKRFVQQAKIDGTGVFVRAEEEGGASGKIATRHFRKLIPGHDFRGVRTTGDKVVNSNPLASQAEAGNVKLVQGPWNADWLDEVEMFTGTDADAHDDQVDSGSGLLADLTKGGLTPADLYGESDDDEDEEEFARYEHDLESEIDAELAAEAEEDDEDGFV
jgi:predicted phage terminase large subunit-like protein